MSIWSDWTQALDTLVGSTPGGTLAVEVGQEAPDFTLLDQSGDEVTLSSFRGKRNVILLFYPLAFSGLCTRQLGGVAAAEDRYAAENAQVIAVSVDSRYVQAAFAEAVGLGETVMLADFEPKGRVAQLYGVYNDERGHSRRASFAIDTAGVVRHREVAPPGNLPDEEGCFRALATRNV